MKIALVAGEASGDQLGAELIPALRDRFPSARFAGVGGPGMTAAGFDAWWPAERLAHMGLAEVLRHLPELLALRRRLHAELLAWKPDLFIGIDAPDFNLPLERRLKARGIRTVHYVSPSVWAWRERRAARLGRSADRVLCLFPMEPPIYARHGVDARFVGHPLADRFPLVPDRAAARAALGLEPLAPVLALLPGSRLGEISRLGADFITAAALVVRALPGLRIVAPMANARCRAAFESLLERAAQGSGPAPRPSLSDFLLLDGRAHEALVASDVVLLASGTAALEAMLAKRPMVVAYRVAPLTAWLLRTFGVMRTTRYSLPNVLANEALVPELIQEQAQPQVLAAAVLAYFRAPDRCAALTARFEELHLMLRRDANQAAAAAIAELIE